MMDIFKRECDIKIEELTKERDQLRMLLAELYQVLGAHDASEKVLTVVLEAANGEPFQTESLLPYNCDYSDVEEREK